MKHFLYRLIQCTWGFVQTFIGFILFLIFYKNKHYNYKGSIATNWTNRGGISLGMFIFVDDNSKGHNYIQKHEYGHTIQSLILGPLYLIIVGIPSFLWCNLPYFKKKRMKYKIPYNSFFIEYNADCLGGNIK